MPNDTCFEVCSALFNTRNFLKNCFFHREKLFILEGVQEALEREQQEKLELKRVYEDLKLHFEENQIKDAQFIQILKKSVEEMISEKVSPLFV